MSTKKIPAQTLETVFGTVTVHDWRDENDNSGERTVAAIGIAGTFTVNGKEYSDVNLYLYRSRGDWDAPSISEYGYRGKLTPKATEKVSAELLKLPELAEYFDVLDEDERMRIKVDAAERQIISDAYKSLQGISQEDAVKIFQRLTDKLADNKTMSQIYFGR